MKTIKQIFSRYTAFLWALLKPLGSWGVFAIAGIDASFLGMPIDLIVATYVYQNPHRFLLYALMASGGSALGSILVYVIGYKGGEALLRKRVSPERFDKIHRGFEEHPFWTLMFPAILPPPFPFKLFVLGAAISEMNLGHFLLAIFAGRFVRFLILSLLTYKFGPDVVNVSAALFHQHSSLVLGLVIAGIAVWLIVRWMKKKRKQAAPEAADRS